MRLWPFHRRRKPGPSPESTHAVEQAERQLRDTKRLSERVNEVADQLAEIRRVNHIAEAVRNAIKGGA